MLANSLDRSLEEFLLDGYTEKMARPLIEARENESNCGTFDSDYVQWAHSHGFLAEHACSYGLNEGNLGDYLSDYEFSKVWPLNPWARIWINDKLTLRLMLSDLELQELMPLNYYYSTAKGLVPLCDNRSPYDNSMQGFLALLQSVGRFAAKPNNGAGAEGFYKLSYVDGEYWINNKRVSDDDVCAFVVRHPNYLFTEFICPSADFSRISPLIHTLRICVLNETGVEPHVVCSYIRFPNHSSDISNYKPFDCKDVMAYHLYSEVDFKKGSWGNSKIVYPTHTGAIDRHPESGELLHGSIPGIEKLHDVVMRISQKFCLLEYMGFDFGITDSGFKLMEINSHPALATPQLFKPYYADRELKQYFGRKLCAIDALSKESKRIRNGIRR